MIEFDKVDLTDLILIIAIAIGFIMAVYMGEKELAMSITSGVFGYIGGSYMKQPNGKSNADVPVGTTRTTTTESISTITSELTGDENKSTTIVDTYKG